MHSKQKIVSKYPFLMEALPFYYGQVNQHDLEKNNLNWDELGTVAYSVRIENIFSFIVIPGTKTNLI